MFVLFVCLSVWGLLLIQPLGNLAVIVSRYRVYFCFFLMATFVLSMWVSFWVCVLFVFLMCLSFWGLF